MWLADVGERVSDSVHTAGTAHEYIVFIDAICPLHRAPFPRMSSLEGVHFSSSAECGLPTHRRQTSRDAPRVDETFSPAPHPPLMLVCSHLEHPRAEYE